MIKYIGAILFLLLPLLGNAQLPGHQAGDLLATTNITLSEVATAALALSPEQNFIQSKNNKAEALKSQASSLFADTPVLSVQHQNDRLLSHQGLREWESAVEFPLWMPGQKSASRQKAKMSKEEALAYDNLAMLQLHGQIREVLWELKISDMQVEQARENLSLSQEFDRDVQKKIAAGNLPRQSALLSSSDVIEQKLALTGAEAEYIHAVREYQMLTGLSEFPENIEETIAVEGEEIKAPILQLYEARVDYLEAEYREVSASWGDAPTLSVGFKRESASFLDRNIDSIGVGVSVPLGASSHTKTRRSEAALVLAEMERERVIAERKYQLELHEAEHELEVCELQLPLSLEHNQMAARNLSLSQKAFDLGEIDLLDHLKIREQYFAAAAVFNQKNLECKRAVARYNQTTGVMLP